MNREIVNMINIASIMHNDGANGPGLRCTVFVQGCDRKCKGCHSSHTWPFGKGTDFTIDELISECTSNPLDGGITFTGGDPIFQYEELTHVVKYLHNKGYSLWLYTGAKISELDLKIFTCTGFGEFLDYFDCIVAEPFEIDKRDTSLKYRGSSNQKIVYMERDEDGIPHFVDITDKFN